MCLKNIELLWEKLFKGGELPPLKKTKNSKLPIKTIQELKDETEAICGIPDKPELGDKVIAAIKWVDGTVIDVVREVKSEKL